MLHSRRIPLGQQGPHHARDSAHRFSQPGPVHPEIPTATIMLMMGQLLSGQGPACHNVQIAIQVGSRSRASSRSHEGRREGNPINCIWRFREFIAKSRFEPSGRPRDFAPASCLLGTSIRTPGPEENVEDSAAATRRATASLIRCVSLTPSPEQGVALGRRSSQRRSADITLMIRRPRRSKASAARASISPRGRITSHSRGT